MPLPLDFAEPLDTPPAPPKARWLPFAVGLVLAGGADALAGTGGTGPAFPAWGAFIACAGWLMGPPALLFACALAACAGIVGLPGAAAGLQVICFAVAALLLRTGRETLPRREAGTLSRALLAMALAGAVAALPGTAAAAGGEKKLLVLAAGVLGPVLWLVPLAALLRLARRGPVPVPDRWGWPRSAAGRAAIAAFALPAALVTLLPLAAEVRLALAALLVLGGGLVGGVPGGTATALAAAFCWGAAPPPAEAAALALYGRAAVLLAFGLAAGAFSGRARERQDERIANVRRYRDLIESLPIGLVELDERGLITQANPMAGTIVGCNAAELLGHPFDRLGTWEARPLLAATTRAIRHKRQSEARFTTTFVYRPDGTARDVQVDWVYQRLDDRPLRVTALFTDVTERRRAMESLRAREHQMAEQSDLLRVTMNALDHGLAAFGPDDSLTEWNSRFPAMLHLPAALSRKGTPAIALFRFIATLGAFGVGVTEAKVRERMNRLLYPPHQDDVPWIGARHLRFTAHTLPDGGWVWRIEDRTEDLRLRDIEQTRQKMEALGQLASGIAHELNNTLQPVFSLSELGVAQVPADTLAARCFLRITDAAQRAESIVRGVLTFARTAPSPSECTLIVPAIKDAVAFIQSGLPSSVRLDLSFAEGVPEGAAARLDRRELGQVLTNLVTNAADAMDSTGTIRVVCAPDMLRRTSAEGPGATAAEVSPAVALRVIDSGRGMDATVKKRIFEPFFTTKGEGRGTGLGLSVAFGIVRNWKGRIDVDSEPGLGSTFTVHIPLIDREAGGSRDNGDGKDSDR